MAKQEGRKNFEYAKFLRESPSKKVMYYMAMATILVSILLVAFAIRPTILTITRINQEIKEKKRIEEALTKKIEAMVELDAQYAQFQEEVDSLQLIFPTSGNFSLFMSNIDAVASRNGFILKGLAFAEYDKALYDINSAVLSPWSVRITVAGPLSNIDNLFKDLEAMPMFPVIDRFNYGVDEEDNLKNFSILMRIYHIENNKFYGE